MTDLQEFLDPVNLDFIRGDISFYDRQFGKTIDIYHEAFPDLSEAEVILVGINEYRGAGFLSDTHPADAIREKLYKLFYWHSDIRIVDIGNIKKGATLNDSYSCLKTILKDFTGTGKTVLILGGSHDITLAQNSIYKEMRMYVKATVIDACVDLHSESLRKCDNFLMEMLTEEPNYVRHYNHIGFQSYFVHPYMLETMDKLRFDCFRVGICREMLEEMEPVMRDSRYISFDIRAIRHSDAPAGAISPNGFSGEEACSLANYAGQSEYADSFGIYGYLPEKDTDGITALQIAQMIWYYIDGRNKRKNESPLGELHNFNQFNTTISNNEMTLFLQSKRTGRWWMQLSEKLYIPCSYKDYLFASKNEIPERWIRAQERNF